MVNSAVMSDTRMCGRLGWTEGRVPLTTRHSPAHTSRQDNSRSTATSGRAGHWTEGRKGGREGGRGNSLRYSRQLWSSVSISKYTASHCDGPKSVLKQCMELHPPCMVGGRLYVAT